MSCKICFHRLLLIDKHLLLQNNRLKRPLEVMISPPWRCSKDSKIWDRRNPFNGERWRCSEIMIIMATYWCTQGGLRDSRGISWQSTSETESWRNLSTQPRKFPRKSEWCSILIRKTTVPSDTRTNPTFLTQIMPLFWNMRKEYIIYFVEFVFVLNCEEKERNLIGQFIIILNWYSNKVKKMFKGLCFWMTNCIRLYNCEKK